MYMYTLEATRADNSLSGNSTSSYSSSLGAEKQNRSGWASIKMIQRLYDRNCTHTHVNSSGVSTEITSTCIPPLSRPQGPQTHSRSQFRKQKGKTQLQKTLTLKWLGRASRLKRVFHSRLIQGTLTYGVLYCTCTCPVVFCQAPIDCPFSTPLQLPASHLKLSKIVKTITAVHEKAPVTSFPVLGLQTLI